jgi:hypothetical protein
MRAGSGDSFVGSGKGKGHGLVDQDMLSGAGSGNGHKRVEPARRANTDGVDIGPSYECLK